VSDTVDVRSSGLTPGSAELFFPGFVAADVDGTLMRSTLDVPAATLAGVRRLRAAAVPFVVCTGRMVVSARRVAAQLGLDDGLIVCYQGAVVADVHSGEWLRHQPIDPATAAEVVRHAREIGIHINAYVGDEFIVEENDDWARGYARHTKVSTVLVDDLLAVIRRSPTKFVLCAEPERVDTLLPRLQELWRGRLYVTRSLPHYLEICDARVSKSAALEFIGDRLCVPRESTVACGDGLNDLDMIAWAGLGVAMAGADQVVRDAADLVVDIEDLGALFERLAVAPRR
jgi:Cof subfamily protein (haloacid dehalogenase superfamily)